jgi:alpha-galactosidase
MFGHLGVEFDVRQLNAGERGELARWIAAYKEWRSVCHGGVMRQGTLGGLTWLQATAVDAGAALFALYRRIEEAPRYTPLHLPAVPHSQASTGVITELAAGTLVLSGAQLRDFGLPLPPLPPESAIVVGIRAV